jgi:hypothetical protein
MGEFLNDLVRKGPRYKSTKCVGIAAICYMVICTLPQVSKWVHLLVFGTGLLAIVIISLSPDSSSEPSAKVKNEGKKCGGPHNSKQ